MEEGLVRASRHVVQIKECALTWRTLREQSVDEIAQACGSVDRAGGGIILRRHVGERTR
jgi:hypothetical protein